jgi:hypothetical protein
MSRKDAWVGFHKLGYNAPRRDSGQVKYVRRGEENLFPSTDEAETGCGRRLDALGPSKTSLRCVRNTFFALVRKLPTPASDYEEEMTTYGCMDSDFTQNIYADRSKIITLSR